MDRRQPATGHADRREPDRGGNVGIYLLLVGTAGPVLGALCVLFTTLVVFASLDGVVNGAAGCETGQGITLPDRHSAVIAATVYSGSGSGAYGAGLVGHYAYAELGLWSEADSNRAHADRIGTALGLGAALAPFTQLVIRAPNGRSVVAEKRDVGMGGPPIDGRRRAIDLWTSTREALGLPPDWSGLVRVEAGPSGAIDAETPGREGPAGVRPSYGTGCGPGSVPASQVGQRIVQVARSQIGVSEDPPGSNCTIYGPCEAWCALFVTWVWRRGGVDVPSLPFSGAVLEWARSRGGARSPLSSPQPGWAALFGSGPRDANTSLHVAIVESVLPDGRITLINGNFANRVMRTGPCLPARVDLGGPHGCEEPGPIYAYAAPE
jgi:hypothetical protein